MITTNGKTVIKRYIAGQIPEIADSIALGVGTTPAAVGDTGLAYESLRVPVTSINADLANDRLVFKCTVNPGAIKSIYEVGLFNGEGQSRSLNLTTPGLASWTNATLDAANARVNPQALRIDYVANGTTNAELLGLAEDLSTFDDTSIVAISYYSTTNLSSTRLRLGTDASNYYEFALNANVTNGYNIVRVARSTATKVGNPDWAAITYAAVRPSATAAGAGAIYFDGVRFEQSSILSNSLLVARTVLGSPIQVDTSIPSDVEYSLEINFT